MANAYRMQGDLTSIVARLAAALGRVKEFGGKDLTTKSPRSYHYMFGMENFNNPSLLADYSSFEGDVAAVESGFATGRGGVTKK